MTTQIEESDMRKIEELAGEAEHWVDKEEAKKDLKEKRGVIKRTLYEGSKKLKHSIPKGKHL